MLKLIPDEACVKTIVHATACVIHLAVGNIYLVHCSRVYFLLVVFLFFQLKFHFKLSTGMVNVCT